MLIFLAPNATIIAPLSKVTPTRVSFVFVFFDKARSYHSNLFPGPGIFYLWCTIIAILSQCFQLYPSPLIFQFLFSCLLSLKFSLYFSWSVKYRQEVTIQGKNVFFLKESGQKMFQLCDVFQFLPTSFFPGDLDEFTTKIFFAFHKSFSKVSCPWKCNPQQEQKIVNPNFPVITGKIFFSH